MINTGYDEETNIGIRENTSLVSDPEKLFVHDNIAKHESGKYDCFSVSYLFEDLFFGNEYTKFFSNKPLIKLDKVPRGPMEKFSFIFPEEIRDIIKKKNDDLKKSKTREDGTTVKEDHYANFFRPRHSDNIITNFIYEAYSKLGWKKFISLMQKHIAEQLSSVDLSLNQELIEYLSIVGNETIVPYEISHNSNDEFLHLIEKGKNGDNEAVIMIISNFFVSSVLGLRSINYSRGPEERGKNLPYKTYLLSRTGMECIWKPDLISPPYERLFDSRRLFENTNFEPP